MSAVVEKGGRALPWHEDLRRVAEEVLLPLAAVSFVFAVLWLAAALLRLDTSRTDDAIHRDFLAGTIDTLAGLGANHPVAVLESLPSEVAAALEVAPGLPPEGIRLGDVYTALVGKDGREQRVIVLATYDRRYRLPEVGSLVPSLEAPFAGMTQGLARHIRAQGSEVIGIAITEAGIIEGHFGPAPKNTPRPGGRVEDGAGLLLHPALLWNHSLLWPAATAGFRDQLRDIIIPIVGPAVLEVVAPRLKAAAPVDSPQPMRTVGPSGHLPPESVNTGFLPSLERGHLLLPVVITWLGLFLAHQIHCRRHGLTPRRTQGRWGGVLVAVSAVGACTVFSAGWLLWPGSFVASGWGASVAAVLACLPAMGLHLWLRQGKFIQLAKRLRAALFPDVPVTDPAKDALGHAPTVIALHTFFTDPETRPPVVVGINGPWGAGKSSVMGMLRTRLIESRFRCVWFNAWQYAKNEQILAALLNTMAKSLSAQMGWRFKFLLALRRLDAMSPWQWVIALLPVAAVVAAWKLGWVDGAARRLGWPADAPLSWAGALAVAGPYLVILRAKAQPFLKYKDMALKGGKAVLTRVRGPDWEKQAGYFEAFSKEFQLYNRVLPGDARIAVFIDDLDRCPPDRVIDVLKAINLIISGDAARDTFFVLGFDQAYIQDCVDIHFEKFTKRSQDRGEAGDMAFGPRYVKKLVNTVVTVPQPAPHQIAAMVAAMGEARLSGGTADWARVAEVVRNAVKGRLQWAIPILAAGLMWWAWESAPSPAPTIAAPTAAVPHAVETGPVVDVSVPSLSLPDVSGEKLASTSFLALLLGLLGLANTRLLGRLMPAPHAPPFAREPISHLFARLADLLPRNPRDVVRLINGARIAYVVQQTAGGTPLLGEREFVALTVLHHRHPEVFAAPQLSDDLARLQKPIVTVRDLGRLRRALASSWGITRGKWLQAFHDLMAITRTLELDAASVTGPGKIARFLGTLPPRTVAPAPLPRLASAHPNLVPAGAATVELT